MCREGLGASPRVWQAPLLFPQHLTLQRLVLIHVQQQVYPPFHYYAHHLLRGA